MTNSISLNGLNTSPTGQIPAPSTELTKDQFLGQMMDILHDSKNGATPDYLRDQILKLAQQNPTVVKELGLPYDEIGIKKEIVTKWCELQAGAPSQENNDVNFISELLSKKKLGKIVEEKVNISGLPKDLQAKLKESFVEKAITNGMCKGKSGDFIAGKIFSKLPKNMRTDENREIIAEYVKSSRQQILSRRATDVSEQGIKFLSKAEGCRTQPYDDLTGKTVTNFDQVTGHAAIGYGHTLFTKDEFEKYQNGISSEQALDLRRQDIQHAVDAVNRRIKVPLTQQQFDALVSLAYNHGSVPLNLARLINSGSYSRQQIEAEFNKIVGSTKRNGDLAKPSGLTKRRSDEIELFFDGDYTK